MPKPGRDDASAAKIQVVWNGSVGQDTTLAQACRKIIVGSAGALTVTVGGSDTTIPAAVCTAGRELEIQATAIKASGSAAHTLLVLY
jgi:hypothetical protein